MQKYSSARACSSSEGRARHYIVSKSFELDRARIYIENEELFIPVQMETEHWMNYNDALALSENYDPDPSLNLHASHENSCNGFRKKLIAKVATDWWDIFFLTVTLDIWHNG
jgi:hypothetical protein